jgi:hypothetical protein
VVSIHVEPIYVYVERFWSVLSVTVACGDEHVYLFVSIIRLVAVAEFDGKWLIRTVICVSPCSVTKLVILILPKYAGRIRWG